MPLSRKPTRGRGLSVRVAPVALALSVLTLCLGAAVALAGKKVDSYFPKATGSGTAAGQFNTPDGLAINDPLVADGKGVDGFVYVADSSNRRVQVFDDAGAFQFMFGRDVIAATATTETDLGNVFEVCHVAADCKRGETGGIGGAMDTPSAIAIDQDTGQLFVVDAQNARVQEFEADGTWIRAAGGGVLPPSSPGNVPRNEIQRVIRPLAPASGFKLTFGGDTTDTISVNASASLVRERLEALPAIGAGNVKVTGPTGGPWEVEFVGALGDLNVNTMGPSNSLGQGEKYVVVEGAGSFEVCTVAADCRVGIRTGSAGAFDLGASGGAIAVSPLDGKVFVADSGNGRVQELDFGAPAPAQIFVRAWGLDVLTGKIGSGVAQAFQFEICTRASGCVNRSASLFGDQPPGGIRGALSIGVDSAGTVYVDHLASNPDSVDRFDSTVSGGQEVADELLLEPLPSKRGPLEIDADADGLGPDVDRLLSYCTTLGSGTCGAPGVSSGIDEFDLSGSTPVWVDTHLVDSGLNLNGIATNPALDALYVTSRSGSPEAHRVYKLDADGAIGTVSTTLDPVSGIGPHAATFSGTANPDGFPASARFEISDEGGPWTALGSYQSIGEGTVAIPLNLSVADLFANTDYQVRISVLRGFGNGTVTSSPQSFSTPAVAPEVTTGAAQARTATEATIKGVVVANRLPTSYRFEYGETTAYGTSIPVPDGDAGAGGIAVAFSERLSGLEPATEYHFRLSATNSQGTTLGGDRSFTTRPAGSAAPAGERAYEMVTPPFKTTRVTTGIPGVARNFPNPATPSLDGERLGWTIAFLPLTDDTAAPGIGDRRTFERSETGWTTETLSSLKFVNAAGEPSRSVFSSQNSSGSSGDLRTLVWGTTRGNLVGLLPTAGSTANALYTRRTGTGTSGFTPWLSNPDVQVLGVGFTSIFVYPGAGGGTASDDEGLLNDDGTVLGRMGYYRGLADNPGKPGDEDPSDNQQLTGLEGGRTVYLQRATNPDLLPSAAKHLVNECTGTGASATLIPARVGSGSAATDTIGTQPCASGQVTSRRGASLGAGDSIRASARATSGPLRTAVSADGSRVFFQSPDHATAGFTGCLNGAGATTDCPPQLFVRQYGSTGKATVRWISRAQGVGPQRIAEMGAGASFQGASKDGRYVYFKTNAPLLLDDPNGGVSITEGSAQDTSWDIYRYELPADRDVDPASGSLLRITGGPGSTADPSSGRSTGSGGDKPPGIGGGVRFLSADGTRAYFVTNAPISSADAIPPSGGSTTPSGTVGADAVRNLYLFDANETGAARWRFIAQIPYADFENPSGSGVEGNPLDSCASYGWRLRHQISPIRNSRTLLGANCFRGTPDGRAVAFFTGGQLTTDDDDSAGDIYLYDADADELTRVTAPEADGAVPYVCRSAQNASDSDRLCNGNLSTAGSWYGSGEGAVGPPEIARGWSGMSYFNVSRDAGGVVSVYFESQSALIEEDVNGDHYDVYQWREGDLSLITPGDSPHDAWFSGNSLDGRDVFFFTTQRIDPRELDNSDGDIYDARIDGGFPYAPPPTPCDVLAFQCEAEAAQPPAPLGAASRDFTGAGNATQPKNKVRKCRKGKVRRKGRCVQKKQTRKRTASKNGRARR